MQFLRKIIRHGLGSTVGALLTIGVGLLLYLTGLGHDITLLAYDFPYKLGLFRPSQPATDVMMVYMDEESHKNLNQPFIGGWDRNVHAALVERLKEDGARAAVFDVIFTDASKEQADQRFAKAIKDFGKVLLMADRVKAAYGVSGATGAQFQPPMDLLLDAAASIGHAEMDPDEDFLVRRHTALIKDDWYQPMAFAAAQLLEAPFTKSSNEWQAVRWTKYYGPPAHLANISYHKVFNTNDCPQGFFKNKVVFVGARTFTKTAGERKDEYTSPYVGWLDLKEKFMPGAEVQATMFLNLMDGRWFRRMELTPEVNLSILVGVLFGIGLMQLRPLYAAMATMLAALGVAVIGYLVMQEALLWFAWTILVVQIVIAGGWSVIYNGAVSFMKSQLLQQSVSMYVSPALAKAIAKSDVNMTKPGAVKQELSILFSDIANFTTMSEGMDTDELAMLMNNYFENAVNNCIQKTDGTVVKYIGDAIFAIWNAPVKQANHAELACLGGIYLRDNVTEFKFKNPKPGLEVRTRIGLHCGTANVGNFGSSRRVDYTALGENINLASRMEGLNKYIGTSVVITGDLEEKVRGKFITRHIGKFILKGFGKPVEVFELLTTPEKAEESRLWREVFLDAQKKFWARDWDGAVAGFNKVLEMKPKDGPANFFIKHIEELRKDPPGPEWQGQIEMHEK